MKKHSVIACYSTSSSVADRMSSTASAPRSWSYAALCVPARSSQQALIDRLERAASGIARIAAMRCSSVWPGFLVLRERARRTPTGLSQPLSSPHLLARTFVRGATGVPELWHGCVVALRLRGCRPQDGPHIRVGSLCAGGKERVPDDLGDPSPGHEVVADHFLFPGSGREDKRLDISGAQGLYLSPEGSRGVVTRRRIDVGTVPERASRDG